MVKARDLKGIAEEINIVNKKQKELEEYFDEVKLEGTLYELAAQAKFSYEFVMKNEPYLIPSLEKYFQDLGYGVDFVFSGKHPIDEILVILSWDEIE